MKYRILKDFSGSQDGRFCESFRAGDIVELSSYLVGCVDPSWIAPVEEQLIQNKAIITEPKRSTLSRKS